MRCLTLAHALSHRGANCSFICRELEGNLCAVIEGEGFELNIINQPDKQYVSDDIDFLAHASWLGCSWQEDVLQTISALDGNIVDWLIVDHYAIDYRWEKALREYCSRILVIDDLANRMHDCDVILDQNLCEHFFTRYDSLVPDSTIRLLGPRYVLLRDEFRQSDPKEKISCLKRVAIFYGGADLVNETRKVLFSLVEYLNKGLEIDVIIGAANPYKVDIEAWCDHYDGVTLHYNVNNIAEILVGADLLFCAGGSITWERCCLGVPAVVTVVASNQRKVAIEMQKRGTQIYIGNCEDLRDMDYRNIFKELSMNPRRLELMRKKSLGVVDGGGVDRVLDALLKEE